MFLLQERPPPPFIPISMWPSSIWAVNVLIFIGSLQMKWWCSESSRYYLDIIIVLADLNEDHGYRKERTHYCCLQGGVAGQEAEVAYVLAFVSSSLTPQNSKGLMPCWFLHEAFPYSQRILVAGKEIMEPKTEISIWLVPKDQNGRLFWEKKGKHVKRNYYHIREIRMWIKSVNQIGTWVKSYSRQSGTWEPVRACISFVMLKLLIKRGHYLSTYLHPWTVAPWDKALTSFILVPAEAPGTGLCT